MEADEAKRQTDDAFRALGRYVYELSRLLLEMKMAMGDRLRQPRDPPTLAEALFGESFPQNISNAFFGMCRLCYELDEEEQTIASRLRKEATQAIETRNEFAHGDWWIGWGEPGEEKLAHPRLMRSAMARKEGPIKWTEFPVTEIDQRSDRLVELTENVRWFGNACLDGPLFVLHDPKPRVRDLLMLMDGRVVYIGRSRRA